MTHTRHMSNEVDFVDLYGQDNERIRKYHEDTERMWAQAFARQRQQQRELDAWVDGLHTQLAEANVRMAERLAYARLPWWKRACIRLGFKP